jgi:hypothetical protein
MERVPKRPADHRSEDFDLVSAIMLYAMARTCADCGCEKRREGCSCGCHAEFCDCHGAPRAMCEKAREEARARRGAEDPR